MTATPNHAQALAAFAERFYGPEWQRPLSRDLGVHFNTIYRVARAAREGRNYATAQQLLSDLRLHLLNMAKEMEPWVQ